MLKRILLVSLLAIASFFVSCSEERESVPQVQQAKPQAPAVAPIIQVGQFTAPQSTVITLEKAKMYVKASAGLVELGVKWSEKIDNANDNEKVLTVNAYNVARDQLCARMGLNGIAEYDWITTMALPDMNNKKTFEEAGLKQE